jgi:hypothetical protein
MAERTIELTAKTMRRSPLPEALPRPVKRLTDRESPWRVIAHVRVIGASLTDDQRAQARRKLGMKLGKFASAIERVSVRVTDVNGPRGGVDQLCRIKVVVSGLPSVVVERRHASADAAIDMGVRAAEEALRRVLGRRRKKPLHRRTTKTVRRSTAR